MEINSGMEKVNRNYKDGIFRRLFDDEDKIRELYNALEGTDYGPETPVEIRTLENAIYMDIKNDLAFTIGGRFVVLVEHQSTPNGNMPVRMLGYVARVYEAMFDRKEFYRRETRKLPTPEFFVLYNGTPDCPEESVMRLSDSYLTEKPENTAEVVVKVYNLAYTKGTKVLERSILLAGYSRMVSLVRECQAQGMELAEAVRQAVLQCRREGVLADFLKQYGTEVLSMLFDVVTKEEYGDIREEEGFERGLGQGIEQGIERGIEQGIERGIEQGIEQGIERGRTEGLAEAILDLLVDKGEVSDALQNRIKEEESLDTLKVWLKLAGKADTVDEFCRCLS